MSDRLRQFKKKSTSVTSFSEINKAVPHPVTTFNKKRAIEVMEAKTEPVTINNGAKAKKTKNEQISCSFSSSPSSWEYVGGFFILWFVK